MQQWDFDGVHQATIASETAEKIMRYKRAFKKALRKLSGILKVVWGRGAAEKSSCLPHLPAAVETCSGVVHLALDVDH